MDNWIVTDEAQEAVFALEMVSEQLHRVIESSYQWKWVIIALHSTLQGFMVLALQGTNGLNPLRNKCAREWMAAYERGDGTFPERQLDNFLNLYKKIKSDRMKMYVNSQPFKPRATQTRSVKMLNRLRNDFIHFVPKGWSLEISSLPQIMQDCIDIISFLAFECGNIIWHEEVLEDRAKELIDLIRHQTDVIRAKYDA